MVKRAKFISWRIDSAKKKRVKTWKHSLKAVAVSGKANVTFRDVSLHRVELAWPKAVSYDSAARLVRLAQEKDASLEILGEPTGIADEVNATDEAASAAPTGIADAARGALVEAAAAAPDDAAASESKRRRIVGKQHSAGHALAGDDAEAATAARLAPVYSAENGPAPADNAQPATGAPLADAASAPSFCIPAGTRRTLVAGSESIATSMMI